jgi:hypothetical protein
MKISLNIIKKCLINNKEWINTGASIATIVALIVTVWIFMSQVNLQKSQEFNEHLSNMVSLEDELKRDVWTLDQIRGENLTSRNIFLFLVIENLKRSASDGKISNFDIKNQIILTLSYANEFNNAIQGEIALQSNPALQSDLRNQIVKNINVSYIPFLNTMLSMLGKYESCLEVKRDIDTCNNANYSTS